MREMKDSGIEWVGQIPVTWDIHPVYSYFGEKIKTALEMRIIFCP